MTEMTRPTQMSFLNLLKEGGVKKSQIDYFRVEALREIFKSKISLSQASGKDGIRGNRFKVILENEVEVIERKILKDAYDFTTYKERLISRGSDRSPRQISIPTIRDRLVIRSICELIHSNIKGATGATPHVLVSEIARRVRESCDSSCFIRIDVRDFYPSIKHDRLERELRYSGLDEFVVKLCMKAVQTPTGSKEKSCTRGIPQGLSVSNALAQIYMHRFDEKQSKYDGLYYRYVDDILCIAPEDQANDVMERIARSLNRRGLSVHRLGIKGKTEIKPISEGIDFLGYHITKTRISIRKSSYDKMFRNILKVVTDYKYSKNDDIDKECRVLYRLNLKITGCIFGDKRRGWMMFFSRTENLGQLKYLDNFVKSQMLLTGIDENKLCLIKSFIKSYHEIRFNMIKTTYIPNFNNYSEKEKIETVSMLTKYSSVELETWDAGRIDEMFQRVVAREVMDLEQDVGGIS